MKKIVLLIFLFSIQLFSNQISYNQKIMISSGDGNCYDPSICCLKNGDFILCWAGYEKDFNAIKLYCRIFNCVGEIVSDKINLHPSNIQGFKTSVCALENGGFVVCWAGYHQQPYEGGGGLLAQVFDTSGNKIGKEIFVNAKGTYAYNMNVCALKEGGFAICWYGYRDGSFNRILMRRFSSTGETLSDEYIFKPYELYSYEVPLLNETDDGQFIIFFCGKSRKGDNLNLYGIPIAQDGEQLGFPFEICDLSIGDLRGFDIFRVSINEYLACWCMYDYRKKGFEILGQFFLKSGLKKGKVFQIDTVPSEFLIGTPKICNFGENQFWISWIEGTGNSATEKQYDLVAKKIYSSGYVETNKFRISNLDGWQNSIFYSKTNNVLLAAWNDYNDKGASCIYAKYFISEINHKLTTYNLIFPKNDLTISITDPVFSWNQASKTRVNFPYELKYDLYLAKNAEYKNLVRVKDIYDSTYQVAGLEKGATYFWHVCAKNIAGDSLWSSESNAFFVDHNATTGVEEKQEIPKGLSLHANYPNPFNPSTTINYELPTNGSVSLKIFDITGRLVTELLNTAQQAGTYATVWNGCEQTGMLVAAGVYIYQLKFTDATGKNTILHKKMSLVK